MKPLIAVAGTKYEYEGKTYFAARDADSRCGNCAFDNDSCDHAPPGCGANDFIWLIKQDYITHRLTT